MARSHLFLMRHGPAEDVADSGRDFDRKLTTAGRARVERVAEALLHKGESPRVIVTSPLVRAKETAEIVAASCTLDEPILVRPELSPGGDGAALLRELANSGKRNVMLVGHEPDLSGLAELATSELSAGFEKAMVVGLAHEQSLFALRFILEPKTLAWR